MFNLIQAYLWIGTVRLGIIFARAGFCSNASGSFLRNLVKCFWQILAWGIIESNRLIRLIVAQNAKTDDEKS